MVGLDVTVRRAVLVAAAALVWWGLWGIWQARSPRPGGEPLVAVWHAAEGRVVQLPLEDYVMGVVAAEVPSDFHLEALKAQAVAARTYALRRMEEAATRGDGAHVSSEPHVHQAWVPQEEFLARWGALEGRRRWGRIREAVLATRGLVLTYEGQLIDALYHASSGGHTEDAGRYFAAHVPYLVGVPDPYSEGAPGNETWAAFLLADVLERLGVGEQAAAGQGAHGAVAVLSRTNAGRAAQVAVGGRIFSGRQVREALGLRSSWFDVTLAGDVVVFHVRGYGHGVGMSQYGADGMARAGYTFEQILAHYYRGAVLERRY